MNNLSLTAISPLDGRYSEKLNDLRPVFSEYGLMKYRIIVEIRWLQVLANQPDIPEVPKLSKQADKILENIILNFSIQDAERIKNIEKVTNHDVKAIEYFIKEHIAGNSELANISEFIHFGCTSEDINNLTYALMLKTARTQFILPSLDNVIDSLKKLTKKYSDISMLSRTHGQAASPTTVGKEIANIIERLKRQIEQISTTPILGKLNGATGNYNAMVAAYPNVDWTEISKKFIKKLGLEWNPYTTQIEPHDYIAELLNNLSRVNTIIIGFDRDMWGYISLNYFKLKSIKHEVGSSTMPHKINPIDFENSEGNLGMANAMFDHMAAKLPISRWQRDLTDSTVLRNIGVGFAHSILAYKATCKGLDKVDINIEIINKDLNNHWEILAEAIQTVMRKHKVEQSYEKLKDFTRGKKITKELLHQFIDTLDLSRQIKQNLFKLTPENYIGYAKELAKGV
ncbi:adenylosuccinate lyase [Gammaproteobacteria bacterium]|nr:adenylosuccinate lyase [Gammaproteobacteria bacterium]